MEKMFLGICIGIFFLIYTGQIVLILYAQCWWWHVAFFNFWVAWLVWYPHSWLNIVAFSLGIFLFNMQIISHRSTNQNSIQDVYWAMFEMPSLKKLFTKWLRNYIGMQVGLMGFIHLLFFTSWTDYWLWLKLGLLESLIFNVWLWIYWNDFLNNLIRYNELGLYQKFILLLFTILFNLFCFIGIGWGIKNTWWQDLHHCLMWATLLQACPHGLIAIYMLIF